MDTIIQFLLVAVSIFIKHSIENYYIIARFNFCQAVSEHCEAESVTSRYFCIVNPRTHQYLFYLIQCSAPQRNLDRLDRPSFMHWSVFCKSPKTFNFEAVWSQNGLKRLYKFILLEISYCNSIFPPQSTLSPICHKYNFTTKAKIFGFRPLASIEGWG